MPNPKPVSRTEHVPVMDGLRGIAILLVAWYHIWQMSWLPNELGAGSHKLHLEVFAQTGFVGVELFFLISGFCLFYPHARHLFEGKPRPRTGTYFNRRALKILPSYWVSLLIVYLVAAPNFGSVAENWRQLWVHLLFIHNFSPYTEGTLNGVLWSLGVEVQFYLLFPFLARAFRKRPLSTYLLMSGGSLAFRQWALMAHPGAVHYWISLLPGFLDCFANGMLAAYVVVWLRNQRDLLPRIEWPMTALALGFAVLVYLELQGLFSVRYTMHDWPMPWQIGHRYLLAAGFAGVAIASSFAHRWWQALVANRLLVFLSGISYNLYLLHQFIARQLLALHLPHYATPDPHNDPVWQFRFTLAAWALAIGVSVLITEHWEKRFLARGWFFWRNRTQSAALEARIPALSPEAPAAADPAAKG